MGTQAHLDFNTWDIPTAAFLDIQDGDDNTAALGDGNKPFRTVNAALSASDFIIIKPCIVFQTILLSSPQDNNKHIHCMDGVEFQNGGLFIVGTQVTRARFTGDAIFTGFFCELVRLVSTNCEVDFECKYADNVRTIVSMSGNPNSSPTLRFSADWLLCHCFNGAGYAVRTIGGADFTFSIKYYFESQHTAWEVRDSANGRLVINCPETRVIPNYTSNYGNANKSVMRVHQFSEDIDVTVNGDLVNLHDVPPTGLPNSQYACLEHSNLVDITNFPKTTINGNLDALNCLCVLSWFNSRYGETNIYGNMINRFTGGGFAGSPFWLQLTNGGAGNQTFRIRDGYSQGSSRFIIGRGKFVYFFDYSIYSSDPNTQDSNFFLEQTGTTNQELYLYNTMCEKGGAIGLSSELVKGNAVGATVYTAQTKGNLVFGATYVDQWADYAQIIGLVVPKF